MGQAKEAELGTDSSMRRNHSNNSTVDENSSLQTPVLWNSLPCFKVLSLHSAKHTSLQGMAPLTAAIMTRNPAPVLHSELFKDVIVHANHHTRPRISSNDESDSLTFSNDRGRRWLLQIGGGTDFCQYCRTTLKFDYISIVPGEATQGEMVLCIDAVVASCEAGDSLVVHYVGDATDKHVLVTTDINSGITEQELRSLLSAVKEDVQVTLIWDAVLGQAAFSGFTHNQEPSWSERLLSSFRVESSRLVASRHNSLSEISLPNSTLLSDVSKSETTPIASDANLLSAVSGLQREEPGAKQMSDAQLVLSLQNEGSVPIGDEHVSSLGQRSDSERSAIKVNETFSERAEHKKATSSVNDLAKEKGRVNLICAIGGSIVGLCTSAFLKVMRESHARIEPLPLAAILLQLQKSLPEEVMPLITSSRRLDIHRKLHIVPPNFQGTKRALLIGINYKEKSDFLRPLCGCHADVEKVKKYLFEVEGFLDQNCMKLMDDGKHEAPTRENITDAFERLARQTNSGDAVFVYYSGYSGRVLDMMCEGNERGVRGESIYPVDFDHAGKIADDLIKKLLVHAMPEGISMTCLIDCALLDGMMNLPFRLTPDDKSIQTYIATNAVVLSGCRGCENTCGSSRESYCTSAFLKALKNDPSATWISAVEQMKEAFAECKLQQVPHLSSTRVLDPDVKIEFSPVQNGASKRAILVGITHAGQDKMMELSSCHKEVDNMKRYLRANHGYTDDNMDVLMDDGQHELPLRDNILRAFDKLVEFTQPGDTCVFFFSGYGLSGMVNALVPFDSTLPIRSDEIWDRLIRPLPNGSNLICLMDCCKAVLQFPFVYKHPNANLGLFGAIVPTSLRKSLDVSQSLADSATWATFLSGLKDETKTTSGNVSADSPQLSAIVQAV